MRGIFLGAIIRHFRRNLVHRSQKIHKRQPAWIFFSWAQAMAALGGLFATLLACNQETLDESDPYQVSQQGFACETHPESLRNERLRSMPPKFIDTSSFRIGRVDEVRNYLAGIPQTVMDYLFQVHRQNGFNISEQTLGGATIGVTHLSGTLSPGSSTPELIPRSINIRNQPGAIAYALQHEIGHAVHPQVNRSRRPNPALLREAYLEGRSHPQVKSYARTNETEYFAEIFSSFYCGRGSHDFLKKQLPRSYNYLASLLPPPVWGQPGGVPDGSQGIRVFIDDDQPEEVYLYVSLPEGTASVRACQVVATPSGPPAGSCPRNAAVGGSVERLGILAQNRVLMKLAAPINRLIPHGSLILEGLSPKGDILQSRTLSFNRPGI